MKDSASSLKSQKFIFADVKYKEIFVRAQLLYALKTVRPARFPGPYGPGK